MANIKAKTKLSSDSSNIFLKSLIKESGNELATLMSEETLSNTTDWIDTGSFALNGLFSADIFKGIPNNKVIALAGEESVGKTYLSLELAKHAIASGYSILYFDSENSTEKEMVVKRAIDASKIVYLPVDTIEDFRDQVVRIANKVNDTDVESRPKLLIILDSIGNLSTRKEIKDIETGNDKKDMTRASIVKSVFRVLNLKLAKVKIPMIINAHVYADVGSFIPRKTLSGGCLTKDSMVLMHNKRYKNINDINVGEFVQTLMGKKEVINIFNYKNRDIITFELEDGSVINCTENHKFLVLDNDNYIWKTAEELNENDFILKNN